MGEKTEEKLVVRGATKSRRQLISWLQNGQTKNTENSPSHLFDHVVCRLFRVLPSTSNRYVIFWIFIPLENAFIPTLFAEFKFFQHIDGKMITDNILAEEKCLKSIIDYAGISFFTSFLEYKIVCHFNNRFKYPVAIFMLMALCAYDWAFLCLIILQWPCRYIIICIHDYMQFS